MGWLYQNKNTVKGSSAGNPFFMTTQMQAMVGVCISSIYECYP